MSTDNTPVKPVTNRRKDGTFGKGNNANPLGATKRGGLKEYDRDKFKNMTDNEKEKFLKTISSELRYKMAEGNPKQDVEAELTLSISDVLDDLEYE